MRVYTNKEKDIELPHLDVLTFLFGRLYIPFCSCSILTTSIQQNQIGVKQKKTPRSTLIVRIHPTTSPKLKLEMLSAG